MAYEIKRTDGSVFATVTDASVNESAGFSESAPLVLVGRNFAGYGAFLNENFLRLLENGANPTPPPNPIDGQLWWDKANRILKVRDAASGIFKTIGAATASPTEPASPVVGDLWYDTSSQQLKVFRGPGLGFIVVGPAFTSTQGLTGAIPETINDSTNNPRLVTGLYVNNIRVAVVSRDAAFTPAAPVDAEFPTIVNGLTIYSSGVFGGTATNADKLDNLDSLDFMRATTNTATTGVLRVQNDTGMFVGAANVFTVNTTATDANVRSNISNGNLVLQANVGGTLQNVARVVGSTGVFAVSNAATVGTTLSVSGNTTSGNLTTGGQVTATGNVRGGNITTPGQVSASGTIVADGNVTGGNITTLGVISSAGNITTAANVSGQFFIGNGRQLTGLSEAVNVPRFINGTSQGNINVPGGNISFTVGGTANVAVFDTTGAVFTGITVPSIQKTGTNAVGNIGQTNNRFDTVFARATSASYADVAERFAADEVMEPGTVVELGGTYEITRAEKELSEQVFGVISTRPALTMNDASGNDATHPPVAMTGRVPVKVIGVVRKGDRLVSAGNGLARAASRDEITSFNVIGRSLIDKTTAEAGTVEAIVTIKN
jgi:hypothetical protein